MANVTDFLKRKKKKKINPDTFTHIHTGHKSRGKGIQIKSINTSCTKSIISSVIMSRGIWKDSSHHEEIMLTFHISQRCVQMTSLEFFEACKHGLAYCLFVGGVVPNNRFFLFPRLQKKRRDAVSRLANENWSIPTMLINQMKCNTYHDRLRPQTRPLAHFVRFP